MISIVLIITIVLVTAYVTMYNDLQLSKVKIDASWSQIDVQLKRRNDLIPNLVSTTKGYAKHEQETLAKVVTLRNELTQVPDDTRQKKMAVSNQITDTLKTVFALSENYPDLKADTSFLKLQEELTNTENKISYARQLYNSCVANFNQKLVTIPTNLIAKMHHMAKVTYLETQDSEKAVPKAEF